MYQHDDLPRGRTRPNPRKLRLAGLAAVGALLAIGGWGLVSRYHAGIRLAQDAAVRAIPTVVVLKAAPAAANDELVLPGDVQAYYEAPIYARTSGYLKTWLTDIGTPVKKGQMLGEIDTPDVDDQLRQAQADLATAEANDRIAQSTDRRWQMLLATDSVPRQEAEEKAADAAAKDALVASAKANVARLQQLEDFKRVVAPFDGVVTARNTDIGALINTGSGIGPELFRVADVSRLRIYIRVPQPYVAAVKPGMTAALHFAEYPRRTFPATLVRTAQAIDPAARTLLVELRAENPRGELFPGGYTEVHLRVPTPADNVLLPVNTLLFRAEGLRVAKLGAGNRVVLVPVTPGRDYGTKVEVVDGVRPGDPVILNPPDSLAEGQLVRVAAPPSKDKGK
ncbi:MAG: efflux RND transporter periplasmic adaptor subunit [Magnetospirillum sp.]|nr:efflux RND transporter periplasmic adaptor subunit [Magnetospirillum sp.]